jgi:hypothetical protein
VCHDDDSDALAIELLDDLDVFRRTQTRYEMERLKDETDLFASYGGKGIVVEICDVRSFEQILATRWTIEQPENVE